MNPFNLAFRNEEQERQFTGYLITQQTERIIQFVRLGLIVSLVVAVYELINDNQVVGVFFSIAAAVTAIVYCILRKYNKYATQLSPAFTFTAFIFPYLLYFLIIRSNQLPMVQIFSLLLMNNLSTYYLLLYQNFMVNSVIHCNQIVMNIMSLKYLFGFDFYLIIYFIYSLYWLTMEYQRLYEKRRLFQESQINHSISNIIDKTLNDKLLVFTFNDDQVKFELEICNQAAQQYIQSQTTQLSNISLPQILKDIIITSIPKEINLGTYIHQHYIASGIQIHDELIYQDLSGYYVGINNKVKIHLFVQQVPKLKFIVNLQTTPLQKRLAQNQGQFIVEYQKMTSTVLHNTAQTLQSYHNNGQCIRKIQYLLDSYQARLKLLNVIYHHVNYKFTLTSYNISQQLRSLLQKSQTLYQINQHEVIVYSDYSLTQLLFQFILRSTLFQDTDQQFNSIELNVKFKQNIDIVSISLGFHPITVLQEIVMDRSIGIIKTILQLIGRDDTIKVKHNSISFELIKNLEQRFMIP